jgi:hypothetical protein
MQGVPSDVPTPFMRAIHGIAASLGHPGPCRGRLIGPGNAKLLRAVVHTQMAGRGESVGVPAQAGC